MADPLHDRVVAAIGHQYELGGEIGRGGMSVVFRARDRRLNRSVAIKVLPPELAYDQAIRMRFTREAQSAAQLSHAHVVPIYDVGERDGIAYFVMANITGGNLATLLAQEPQQPFSEVRRVLREVADALDHAHQRGLVHRDVKPDNVLLDADTGRAMVTDFGIARAMEAGARLTQTGIAVGTPAYMSPEQATGEREIDGRSDIYSLGVLAYQMLTGRVPFTGSNPMALLLKHVSERPRPIAELRPDTPKVLREAVERALMKDPEDRWPTAAALRDALASEDAALPAWRSERREPVRYTSPIPESARRDRVASREPSRAEPRPSAPRREILAGPAQAAPLVLPSDALVMEQEHLALLTLEQRADLRLWHGRVNLYDRIKAMRGYSWLTLAAWAAGITGFAFGASGEAPPLVVAPLVPIYMSRKVWLRGKSLKQHGLKLKRVLLMPRAKWVIPRPPPPPSQRELEKLAPREVLDSPLGTSIRRAVDERAAILAIVATLSKADRSLISDLVPTVNALVERAASVAQMLYRLDQSMDPTLGRDIDARIAEAEASGASLDLERHLGLLKRQRATLDELLDRRATLARQLENAVLTLCNLRLDVIKLRSSGLQSALSDVSNATQEARAVSREIGAIIDAAEEMRGL